MLKIGAATEVEMKEKKARVEDALHATRAAVEEGIVPGGGVAYLRAASKLDDLKPVNEDQETGIEIVRRSLEEPIRMIVENAGQEGSVVVNKVKEGKDDYGFNASHRTVREPGEVGRHRSDKGGPHCTRECRIGRSVCCSPPKRQSSKSRKRKSRRRCLQVAAAWVTCTKPGLLQPRAIPPSEDPFRRGFLLMLRGEYFPLVAFGLTIPNSGCTLMAGIGGWPR